MADEKRCCTCHQVRPLSDFNVRRRARDGLQSRCRPCSRAWYVANRNGHRGNVRRRNDDVRRANRARLADYLLEHPCVDCGETDVAVLEFDHDGDVPKVANVGELLGDAQSWARIEREIAKCSVRCANCHRRVTGERCGSWRSAAQQAAASARHTAALTRLAAVLG